MSKIKIATTVLFFMLHYSPVNAETCRMKDDLINLTTMHFSICLAEYNIQYYTKSEVDYDLMKCGKKVNLAMSKYFKSCSSAQYIITTTTNNYILCKTLRSLKRATEVEKGINSDGINDQEICERTLREKNKTYNK